MSIEQELKDAHMEYLQDQWDRWLLNDWKNPKAMVMKWSVENFIKKHKISHGDFYELKRVPLNARHQSCLVTRFVAAYLPTLNNLLWDSVGTTEQILSYMKTLQTLNNPADRNKAARERREFSKSAREAAAETRSHTLVKEQRKLTSPSNWGHCK